MSNDININDLENEVKEEFDTDTAFDAEKEYPNDAEEIERSDEDDTSDGDLVGDPTDFNGSQGVQFVIPDEEN